MKQLTNPPLSRARQNEDFDFHRQTLSSARAMLSQEGDKAMVDAYAAAVDAFDAALVPDTKNSHTEELKAADETFDELYVNTHAYARAIACHPEAEVAAQGRQVLAIFDKYGNITKLGYSEEYGAAHHLLQDLNALDQTVVEATHLGSWIAALAMASAQVSTLRDSKAYENSTHVTGYTKECRLAADEAYKVFAQRVNALAIIMGEEHYGSFIDVVNTYIAELQSNIKARETRAENEKKKEEEKEENSKDESGEMTDENGAPETPENAEN